jgi:predicted TIM-barrel fold metal-dependent hydrolase
VTGKLLDANAMLGRLPHADVGEGSPAALVKTMDRLGIGKALVYHSLAWRHDPQVGNELLLREIADEPRLSPCWVVLPDTCDTPGDATRLVARARARGVLAVRTFPADHGYSIDDADSARLLDAVSEASLPVFLDADQADWSAVERIATRRPGLKLVICKVGYRALRRLTGVLSRSAGVHVDLSYLSSHLGMEWLVDRLGPHQIVFGTGMPERDPAGAVTRLMLSELSETAIEAIGRGNALRLLPAAGQP